MGARGTNLLPQEMVRDALKLPLVPFHREALASLAGLESFDRR